MNSLIRAYDKMIVALAIASGAAIITIFFIILGDVAMRTAGLRVPAFAIASSETLLIYATMFAAPYVARERGHVHIGILINHLTGVRRRLFEILICGAVIVATFIFSVISTYLFWTAFRSGIVDVRGIDVPVWIMLLPCPVGFLLLATEFTRFLFSPVGYFTVEKSQGAGL